MSQHREQCARCVDQFFGAGFDERSAGAKAPGHSEQAHVGGFGGRHIDFCEVTAGQAVRTNVRIELTGNPVGTRNGGVLEQLIHEIEIECLPSQLPEVITGDISALDVNESFRVNQLAIPEGIRIFIDPEETVASIKYVKEEAPAASDETADAAADVAPASDAAAK